MKQRCDWCRKALDNDWIKVGDTYVHEECLDEMAEYTDRILNQRIPAPCDNHDTTVSA
jgi:hypothetical protein